MIEQLPLVLGLVLGVAAQHAESHSPTTRRELLRELREQKRNAVRPYAISSVEKRFLSLDKREAPAIGDQNWKGFYPRLAWPSRGSGVALGTRYWRPDFLGPVDASGAFFYSYKGYQHYDLQLGLLPHFGERIPGRSWKNDDLYELGDLRRGLPRFPLYLTMRYRYLPEDDFYGLGPDSSFEDRTKYLQEETRIYVTTGLQPLRNFVWMVNAGYHGNSLGASPDSQYPDAGERFDESSAPGLERPPDYLRFGTQLFADFRDEPGNPQRGGILAFIAERFDDRKGEFSFTRAGVDARAFVPLASPQRILALRALVLSDRADEGNKVPFFMQESLGGSHTLRGYDSFRWRGEKVMLYQVEYRWEPVSFWELALFTDAGAAAESWSSLDSSPLNWDWGFGSRFKTYRDVVIRIEIAFSRETTRYFFRGSASF